MSQDNKSCKCSKGFQESVNRTMCLGKYQHNMIVLAGTNGYEVRANMCNRFHNCVREYEIPF